jgi:hypothetical protein
MGVAGLLFMVCGVRVSTCEVKVKLPSLYCALPIGKAGSCAMFTVPP